MHPASTVMVSLSASKFRMRLMRDTETTTSLRVPVGIEPPTRPVLPAWGTIAMASEAQSATTCATSSVFPGRTTAMPVPANTCRQSV